MMQHPTCKEIDAIVGRRLRQLRLQRGLSQEAVADATGEITYQQMQKYETGTNRISASRLWQFSQILKVQPADFFTDMIQAMPGDCTYSAAPPIDAAPTPAIDRINLEMSRALAQIPCAATRRALLKLAQLVGDKA